MGAYLSKLLHADPKLKLKQWKCGLNVLVTHSFPGFQLRSSHFLTVEPSIKKKKKLSLVDHALSINDLDFAPTEL